MTLNPSKFADFILDKDGKIVKHHAEKAERTSKHFSSVFKKMEILLIFYGGMAMLCISTQTENF